MSEIASELPSAFAGPADPPASAPLPAPPVAAAPAAPAEPARVKAAGEAPLSDGSAFLVTVVLQSARATLEALGFGHPARIPIVLVIWIVTTIFLGLPTVKLADPTWQEVLRYGRWTYAGWVAAIVEVGGLFIFQLLWAGPLVSRARRRVPQLEVQTQLARGEALYWTEVHSAEELKTWMEGVKAWTQESERVLTETISAAAADGFRRPSVIQVYKHRQRFNDAHNGWLDLLSKRLDALRDLSRGLKTKPKRFVQDPES